MGTSPNFSPAHPRSFSHDSETRRASSTRRPVPHRPGWYPRHLLHLCTKPWHVSQTLITSRLPQEKLTVTDSPHVCVQGSGPSLDSRGGGGRLAAHARLALRSLASRAARRLRTPRRSLARVIPSTPYRRHSQSIAQPSRNQRPHVRRPMRSCSLPNGTTARNPSPPQGNVVRGFDED